MIDEDNKLLKTQKEQQQKRLSWGKMMHAQVEIGVVNKIASIN